MPNSSNLQQEPPKWNNLPTTAIRIPELFKPKIIEYAQYLDTDPAERESAILTLSDDVFTIVKTLSQERRLPMEEVVRIAIATERYFWKERKAGSKVLLQKSDKEIREVVFR
jgi:hypothetical protein